MLHLDAGLSFFLHLYVKIYNFSADIYHMLSGGNMILMLVTIRYTSRKSLEIWIVTKKLFVPQLLKG